MNKEKRVHTTNAKTKGVRYSDPISQSEAQIRATNEHQKKPTENQMRTNEIEVPTKASSNASMPDLDAKKAGAVGKQSKSKQIVKITSLEQFIAHAYSLKGRKLSLKPKVERQIAQDPRLSEEAYQRLIEASKKDITFAVPRQLLLAAQQVTSYPGLQGAIRDFVRNTLLRHPIFLHKGIETAIRNLSEAPAPSDVLMQIATTKLNDLPPEFNSSLKAAEFEQLRTNAVYCMAIWVSENKGLTVAALTDMLFTSLWAPKAQKLTSDASKRDIISGITELAGVGLACDEYRGLAYERLRVSESANREVETLRARVHMLEADLKALRLRIPELEESREREQQAHYAEINSLRAKNELEAMNLRNDMEIQRTRLLRRMKSDVHLLEEGLQALSRTEPKVHVMVDHAERVTDALRQEIKQLQGD
ncbi:MAG: hypothetical protein KGI54_07600 [Pseudomonadota bacterium]|nr:hypothetical protein [Pseudomonadota bacterium]